MDKAVPDCLVTGYEGLIESLELPDPDDRHVVAAAIRCGAQIIVTNNLKDFPSEVLDQYGIEAQYPDEFLEYQFGLRPNLVIRAAKEQRARWQNPPTTAKEYLERLSAQGLVVTAETRQLKPVICLLPPDDCHDLDGFADDTIIHAFGATHAASVAKADINDYFMRYYNWRRPHAANGGLSPGVAENQFNLVSEIA
jgi:transposase InsO family protein